MHASIYTVALDSASQPRKKSEVWKPLGKNSLNTVSKGRSHYSENFYRKEIIKNIWGIRLVLHGVQYLEMLLFVDK